MITQNQIEKLPKWAQQEINRLTNENESLKNKLASFNGEAETNTFIRSGRDKIPLPKNSRISFEIGLSSFDIIIDGDLLNVHHSGDGKLVVMPCVSNVVNIAIK